jgi:pimeloyl-ACP methyl ester carboxylesterase
MLRFVLILLSLSLVINLNLNNIINLKDTTLNSTILNLIQNWVFQDSDKPTVHTYSEKVISAGYDFEEHKIRTADGYILTAWRIPRMNGEPFSTKKKPILLQHGFLDDSWTFFAMKNATDCLPIILAQHGYDVWLTNSRGNIFSYEHINPDYDSAYFYSPYWNFTFHEMINYDLPAHIDYIRNLTGYEKLSFIGHSQGSFQLFMSFLENPEFIQNSIDKFVALGTVVTIFNSPSKILKIFADTGVLSLLQKAHLDDLLYIGTSFGRVVHYFCTKATFICSTVINSIVDLGTTRIDYKEVENLFYYEPGGTSTKNLIHWVQIYSNKILQQFDYGQDKNIKIYGQPTPPLYNVDNFKKFNIKSFLTISDSDPFSDEKDLDYLLDKVQNRTDFITVKNLTGYNHLDYLWSTDADKDIYPDLINFLLDSN